MFGNLVENPLVLITISTISAAIPVAVWLSIFVFKSNTSRKAVFIVFCLGCLTAPAMLGIQHLWDKYPQFNLAEFIEGTFSEQHTMFIFTFILFGAMEEILKLYVVRAVDVHTTHIKKINDAIKFSIVSALGFSFTENIYYLYHWWPSLQAGELAGMYIFRSMFTTCAHLIFSGVFGYYYGVGKFSMVMTEHKKLTQGHHLSTKVISKIFRLPLSESFRQRMVVKGLFIAIVMHAIFNYLLQFNIIYPVIIFVVCGYMFTQYLLRRKAGHLILLNDPSKRRISSMVKKDEDVVVELLGMWFNDKKFVDVIHVCERLLERDPDNSVVKLFKAKAMDKMTDNDTYKKILSTVVKTKDDLSEKQRNIIDKYTREKEMFKKVKAMIKKQIEKEGKKWVEPKKAAAPAIPAPAQPPQNKKTFKLEEK